jgi:hypothetical protein
VAVQNGLAVRRHFDERHTGVVGDLAPLGDAGVRAIERHDVERVFSDNQIGESFFEQFGVSTAAFARAGDTGIGVDRDDEAGRLRMKASDRRVGHPESFFERLFEVENFELGDLDGLRCPMRTVAGRGIGKERDGRDRQGGLLKVGQAAPDFTLPDVFGKEVSLKSLLTKGPVVISFYRGEWRPFCNIEMHGLQEALPKMRELDATLIAISPEKPEHGIIAAEKNKLTFPVLSDFGNKVARQLG